MHSATAVKRAVRAAARLLEHGGIAFDGGRARLAAARAVAKCKTAAVFNHDATFAPPQERALRAALLRDRLSILSAEAVAR